MSTLKIDAIQKCDHIVYCQALPIYKYNELQIVVIKYGGNAMKNETLKQNVITDIVLLSKSIVFACRARRRIFQKSTISL